MRRRVSKRQILRRLEAVEAQLARRSPTPLAGQQTIDLPRPRYEQPTLTEDDQQ